mgnify:CR=1 FL=1
MSDHRREILSLLGDDSEARHRISTQRKAVILTGMPFVDDRQLAREYLCCHPYCEANDLALLLLCAPKSLTAWLQSAIDTASQCMRMPRLRSLTALNIGTMPQWQLSSWISPRKSIRQQINRAKRSGVVVDQINPARVEKVGNNQALRDELHSLIRLHCNSAKLPPLGYIAKRPAVEDLSDYDSLYVARYAGQVVALACIRYCTQAATIYIEHLFRHRTNGATSVGPLNGMTELLLHEIALRSQRGQRICLGLSPLADVSSPILKVAAQVTSGLYPFKGIERFRSRLHPDENLPMYLYYPDHLTRLEALYKLLCAFSAGHPLRYLMRSL